MFFFSPAEDVSGESDFLYTPKLDFTFVSPPLTLSFNVAYAGFDANHYDSLIIRSTSSLCDSTGKRLWADGGVSLATAANQITEFIPDSSEWKNVQIVIDELAGQNVQLAFEAKSGWGNNLYIDDIHILHQEPIPTNNDAITAPSSLKIYPNPSSGSYILAHEELSGSTITVFNVVGDAVTFKTNAISANKTQVDLSGLPYGVYFIQLSDLKGKTFIERVVLMPEAE